MLFLLAFTISAGVKVMLPFESERDCKMVAAQLEQWAATQDELKIVFNTKCGKVDA